MFWKRFKEERLKHNIGEPVGKGTLQKLGTKMTHKCHIKSQIRKTHLVTVQVSEYQLPDVYK